MFFIIQIFKNYILEYTYNNINIFPKVIMINIKKQLGGKLYVNSSKYK